MHTDLHSLLKYKNHDILNRYQLEFPNNKLAANEALKELLKFLWLANQHQEDLRKDPNNPALKFNCAIHHEMKEIDDMWHTFILFSQEYFAFCEQNFGHYIHHNPNTEMQKSILNKAEYQQELSLYLGYIYDHLGEESLKKWFNVS